MLELLLRVATETRPTADVAVQVSATHRIVDLAAAVARHLDAPVPAGHTPHLGCRRLGRILDPDQAVIESELLSGDVVQLGLAYDGPGPLASPPADGLYCDVISGPSAGASLALRRGRLTVGRDPSCDLLLEDPTVSKRHAVLTVDPAGRVGITPVPGHTNPLVVDGVAITAPRRLPLGAVVQLGSCAMTVRRYRPTVGAERDQLGQIAFNRTPYRHPDLRPVQVRGPGQPPAPYEPRPLMLAMILLPLVGGVTFALLLGRWYLLLFALLSPLSMLGTWWSERRRGGTSHRQQVAAFQRRYERWLERYDAALRIERRRRCEAAPDIVDLARRADLRTADLWPRTRWTDAFLELRVGLGADAARTITERPEGAGDDPDARIDDAIDVRRVLRSVPITVDLVDLGVLAVHGPPHEVETVTGAILTQAATLHSPDDLVLCGYLHERRSSVDWLKWLPHTRTVASPLEGRHLTVGRDAADDLLRRLLEVIAEREPEQRWPRILLVLDGSVEADQPLVAAVLESGPPVGVHALWVGEDAAGVPRQARAVLACPPIDRGELAHLWFTDPTTPTHHLDPDRLGPDAASRVARALAPVRDASSASATTSIPRVAPLLPTLGLQDVSADAIVRRWQAQATRHGLAAPIGIGPSGPLLIDLVEHGPHGLIAGTSGAGKSELLRSAIAALAASHPPTRLNLLFIDYKGGASSSVFQGLPHTVGSVTNLDAELARRALVSLRAELDRRMRLLEGRAKDLGEMLERHPDEAPASLVIVVDEFATLVKEIPDFVHGMVDIAQRGRSLGIHLILATQRPAGAVDDDILANTNLRVALRMLDTAESSSILGSSEAARIPVPLRGRGFARLGAGEVVEFQAAYSGAPFQATGGATPLVVESFPADGRTTLEPRPASSRDDDRSHLDVLLEAVASAAATLGLPRGRRPWLEDLPAPLDLGDVLAGRFGEVAPRRPGRDVVVGVLDEPQHQRQRPLVVDLEDRGGLLAFGTGGSGRTTLLRTVVASAVTDATTQQVRILALDFGGGSLDALGELPHVVEVARGDDVERVTRIIMYLETEVERRQRLVAAARVDDRAPLDGARASEPLPRLLLLLDGVEAFLRAFERTDLYPWVERLVAVVLGGRSVGIHLVGTTDRRAAVPAQLLNAVGGRIVLRAVDADALTDLGVPPAIARSARLGDGRALLADGTTLQVATAGGNSDPAAQVADLAARAAATRAGRSVHLPELPEQLSVDEVAAAERVAAAAAESFVLGVADLTLEPVRCDVRLQHLAVIGPGESGRSTALRTAACGLAAAGRDVWVIADGMHGPLAADRWAKLATRRDEHAALVDELASSVEADSQRPILVVDRAELVDEAASPTLETLLRDDAVRLLAGVEFATMTSYAAGWRAELKRTRRLLFLQPDELGDLSVLTTARIRLRPGQPFPPGRGVLVAGRDAQLLQVATWPAPVSGRLPVSA